MKIIDRYLLKNFVAPFLFCLLTFVLLYVVIDLFDKLNEMIENKVDLWLFIPYYLNFIPLIIVQTSPIAVLVSIMYSLGMFNRHNEITAMRSSGISLMRILRPLIAAGFIISVFVFLINDRIVPDSAMNASEIKEEKIEMAKKKKKAKRIDKTLENIAFYGQENKIIYARRYKVYKNILQDIIIYGQDATQNIVSKTTATEASWDNSGWLGKNLMFFKLDDTGRIKGEPEFHEESYLNIKEGPEDFRKRRHQTEFMSFEDLNNYIERLSFTGGTTIRNLKVDLHQKTALPFANFVVVLIASPFAIAHMRRGGLLIGIGISMVIVLAYYAMMSVSLAFGKAGFIPPIISAWLANILFAVAGLVLISRHR